jgi:hypothetical protein
VEASPSGHVEHAVRAEFLEMADKKIALALSALVPVDEFVPLIDKTPDVFVFVMAGFAHCFGGMAVFLDLFFLLQKVSRFYDKSLIFLGSDYFCSGTER